MIQQFVTPQFLENKIAFLEPLNDQHFNDLIRVASDAALWQWSPRKIETKEDILEYLQEAMEEKRTGVSIPFVICDKRTSEIAGCTRYSNLSPSNKHLEIGWTWIGTKFQQTGLNRAVKFELLKYGFEVLDLNRIELKTDVLNTASRNAMKKIGATEEGVFRSHIVTSGGRIRDTIYFSIVKKEWPLLKETIFSAFL